MPPCRLTCETQRLLSSQVLPRLRLIPALDLSYNLWLYPSHIHLSHDSFTIILVP